MSAALYVTTKQYIATLDPSEDYDIVPIEPSEPGIWLLHSTSANHRWIFWTWERRMPRFETQKIRCKVCGAERDMTIAAGCPKCDHEDK